MIALTVTGISRMSENNQLMEKVITQHNVKTNLITNMYIAARERSVNLLNMQATDDAFERDEYFLLFNNTATRFSLNRKALGEQVLDKFETELLKKQAAMSKIVYPIQNKVADLLITDEIDAAHKILIEEAIPGQDKTLSMLKELLAYEQESARKAYTKANAIVKKTTRFMLIMALSTILISMSIALFVTRKISRDEKALRLARDNLEEKVKERTRELSEAYDDLQEHEQKIEIKNQELETLSNKLSKYLSPQVYASIFTGKQEVKLDSQRKKLTVLFADLVGFTQMSDRMEAEDLTKMVNIFLSEMSQIALKHGATIDKFMGDAIMLFFGDPETKGVEKDALACVTTALVMQQRMKELEENWISCGLSTPLACRIGIHTGYCTVGNFGSEERMDYTIIGSPVNLASRLEHESPVGGILISSDTYTQVSNEIACEPMGSVQVKGFAYPVETYRVNDFIENIIESKSAILSESLSISLNADPESMSAKEKEDVLRVLKKAIDRIQSS
jgi:class 3 adenylate cyclase